MLTLEEFITYIQENVMDYLPPSYDDARMEISLVTKNNDNQLHALLIRKDGEHITPTIYMEQYYESYRQGESLDHLVGEVADLRLNCSLDQEEDQTIALFASEFLQDYDQVKDSLRIRLCDPELNDRRLSGLVYTMEGDFAATYHVAVQETGLSMASVAVTPQMVSAWDVDITTLRNDALQAEQKLEPVLTDLYEVMECMMMGKESQDNLLENPGFLKHDAVSPSVYVLTDKNAINAASLILQKDLMAKIGTMMGTDYFILPSSQHEVLLIPDNGHADVWELSEMVKSVNDEVVSRDDLLSDKVQYYDCSLGKVMNAVQHTLAKEQDIGPYERDDHSSR